MKYTYVSDYKDNDKLRNSFNELTERTFGFNFVEWFSNGFWGDKYIPCSLADGDKIVANVSVSLMDFKMDGIKKSYIQIGTVMTDQEYKGQGLSRYLMERVLFEYKEKVEGIYLFGNDSVLDFYPKFGFSKGIEYQYSKIVNFNSNRVKSQQVDLTDNIKREKFLNAVKNSVCNEKLSLNNFGLIAFWATGPMKNLVYYNQEEMAYIIADINKEELYIYQIIASHKIDLNNIVSSFGRSIRKVILGFTPYNPDGYDIKEFHKEDCTFFYLGKDLEKIAERKLMFPALSHA